MNLFALVAIDKTEQGRNLQKILTACDQRMTSPLSLNSTKRRQRVLEYEFLCNPPEHHEI